MTEVYLLVTVLLGLYSGTWHKVPAVRRYAGPLPKLSAGGNQFLLKAK